MPKPRKESKPQLFKHKHCSVCSTPIRMDRQFCSPKCEEEEKKAAKRRRLSFLITILLFPIVFVALMLSSLFFAP